MLSSVAHTICDTPGNFNVAFIRFIGCGRSCAIEMTLIKIIPVKGSNLSTLTFGCFT